MNTKLYVGNLSYNTTQESLEALFSQVGAVTEVVVVEDRETRRPRGFGFVHMADETGARAAIEQLDGKQLDGRAIKVAEATPPKSRDSRDSRDSRGGGSGGYGGGSGRSSRW